MKTFPWLAAACVLLAAQATVHAQTLYGIDGGGTCWEFTSAPGAPCGGPNPMRTPCAYSVTPPCLGPVAAPVPPPPDIIGDVAVNCLDDTVFITDGIVIEQYVGDTSCGTPPPCTPIQSFFVPTALGMGPLTGMGLDELGTWTGGVPTLWITDGLFIAGIGIPVACGPAPILCGPVFISVPNGTPLTDVTWDPNPNTVGSVGSLWACDAGGAINNIVIPLPCPGPGVVVTPTFFFPPVSCGLTLPLQGIAYDLATPGVRAGRGHLYVTDGFTVEYIDVGGLPAAPQFYTPTLCTPTNAPLKGLAYASHGTTYGAPRIATTIGSSGQSCSPGPTFAVEYTNEPAGTTLVGLLINYQSAFGPGYACPPLLAAGTTLWVNPFRPTSLLLFLPPSGGACRALPLPIPAGFAAPPGLKVYMQFVFRAGLTTLDATEGLAVTITAP